MTSIYMLIIVALLSVAALICVEHRKRVLRKKSWEELLDMLLPVNAEWIVLVALEYRELTAQESSVASEEMWRLLGGWRGIKAMFTNAERLYVLAAHAESWGGLKAAKNAELMRRDGRRLRAAAAKAAWKYVSQRSTSHCAPELKRAASAYFGMTERLIELYENRSARGHLRLLAKLRPYLFLSSETSFELA